MQLYVTCWISLSVAAFLFECSAMSVPGPGSGLLGAGIKRIESLHSWLSTAKDGFKKRSSSQVPKKNIIEEIVCPDTLFGTNAKSVFREDSSYEGNVDEDVKFYLQTRRNPTERQELNVTDPNSILQSEFNAQIPVKFVIHGWESSVLPGTGADAVKNALLEVGDFNVVLVNWSQVYSLSYTKSVQAIPLVGAQVAKLMRLMVKLGSDLKNIHLIGHSLGAHVVGSAGSLFKTNDSPELGRITGLDPAGPCFSVETPDRSLDPTDAIFVDVLHTNGGLLGMAEPVGHVDFYPNGGLFKQPNCTVDIAGMCSHCFAFELFRVSILKEGSVVGNLCSSWDQFRQQSCNDNPKIAIGLNTDQRARGKCYLDVSSIPPAPITLSTLGSTFPEALFNKKTPPELTSAIQC